MLYTYSNVDDFPRNSLRRNVVMSPSHENMKTATGTGGPGAYLELTKPGIACFVMTLTGVSCYVAAGGAPGVVHLIHTVLGTGLATGGALSLNQYVERDPDAFMARTRGRPIPSGRVSPRHALAFGLLLTIVGAAYLWAAVGWLPACLTLLSSVLYVLVYTPLKMRTSVASLVGAFPGALPVLVGWSAAAGTLSPQAFAVFGIFFIWQLPHILSLAWMCREDYARVGFLMAPPGDPRGRLLSLHMVAAAAALVPVSLSPVLLGLTGGVYAVGALLASVSLLAVTLASAGRLTDRRARRVFIGTLLYQPCLLVLLVVDTLGL